jgi:hypothetical protein
MSQSIQPAQEQMLFPSGSGNASAFLETSGLTPELFADVSQSKFVWAVSLLLLLGLARLFTSGRNKLPPGVKPLPRLPGSYTYIVTDTNTTNGLHRSPMGWSFLGRP